MRILIFKLDMIHVVWNHQFIYREPLKKAFPGCVKLGEQVVFCFPLRAGERNFFHLIHTTCEGFFMCRAAKYDVALNDLFIGECGHVLTSHVLRLPVVGYWGFHSADMVRTSTVQPHSLANAIYRATHLVG